LSQSVPQLPVVVTTPESSEPPHTPSPTPTLQENLTLISKEEALSIAKPIIEDYCQDNNRVLLSINASVSKMADYTGARGGPSFPEVMDKNLPPLEAHNQYNLYPVWGVVAEFAPVPLGTAYPDGRMPNNPQHWISGYTIFIWADTGQVFSSGPDGVM
jgi:hypothetical protein